VKNKINITSQGSTVSSVCRGWNRLIGTSGGVVVGQTVLPVRIWEKGCHKLFNEDDDYDLVGLSHSFEYIIFVQS